MTNSQSVPWRLPSGAVLHVDGPEHATPVLLLHGVGGAAWSWKPQIAALAPAYRVYTWEARGHGEAEHVADAGLADYLQDAREALEAVATASATPPAIVGHSMGGLLATLLASDPRTSAQVRALFLVDPVYAGSGAAYGHFSPLTGRIALALCTPLIASFQRGGALSRGISRFVFEHAFEDRERMRAAWIDQSRQRPVEYRRMLRESFTGPTDIVLRDVANEIDVPTVIVEGSSGERTPRFLHLVATLERRLGPRFRYVQMSGGHYLQLDRPGELTHRLLEFLAEI